MAALAAEDLESRSDLAGAARLFAEARVEPTPNPSCTLAAGLEGSGLLELIRRRAEEGRSLAEDLAGSSINDDALTSELCRC